MNELSLMFARAFGLYFLAVGISTVIRPHRFMKFSKSIMQERNEVCLFIGALVALLIGAFTISLHNLWSLDRALIITLIGWLSFIKGSLMLLVADYAKLVKSVTPSNAGAIRVAGSCYLALGVLLTYCGFFS